MRFSFTPLLHCLRRKRSTALFLAALALGPAGQALAQTNFAASDNTFEDRVEMTWSPAVDASGAVTYRVFRDERLLAEAGSDTSYADTTARSGVTYFYCVTAIIDGEENYPEDCDDGSRTLLPPQDLVASDQFEDRIELNWTDQSQVEVGYLVFRGEEPIDTLAADQESYIDTAVPAGVTSFYQIFAVDALGDISTDTQAQGLRLNLLAPQAVQASDNLYEDRIEVTWEDISQIESAYRVVRISLLPPETEGEQPETVQFPDLPPDTQFFVDTTVAPNEPVRYQVQTIGPDEVQVPAVVDENGQEVTPPVIGNQIAPGEVEDGMRALLGPVLDLVASDGEFEDQVVLNWTDPSQRESSFVVVRDEEPIAELPPDTETYVDTTAQLAPDPDGTGAIIRLGLPIEHVYRIVTFDADGNTANFHEINDLGSRRPLDAPSDLQVSQDRDGLVELTWTDNSEAETAHLILRNGKLLDSASANAESFRDTTGMVGVTYTYGLAAQIERDFFRRDGSVYASDNFTTPALEGEGRRLALFAPSQAEASDDREDGVELTWTDNSEAEAGYIVFRDGLSIGILEADQERFADTGTAFGAEHHYEVVAVEANGNQSPKASAGPGRRIVRPPLAVSASDGQDAPVMITWSDRSGIEDGYNIYRRRAASGQIDMALLAAVGPNVETYADETAQFGTVYDYCIRAAATDGSESEPGCDSGGLGILAAPQVVNASSGRFGDRVEISWTAVDESAGYRIYRRQASQTDSSMVATPGPGETFFSDTAAEPGVLYEYCVASIGSGGGRSAVVCASGRRALVQASDAQFETGVEIAWTPAALDAILYKITRDGAELSVVASQDSSYVDSSGDPATVYQYCVSIVAADGSEGEPVCDAGSRIIFAPSDVAASDGRFEDRVEITWTDRSRIETDYRLERDGQFLAFAGPSAELYSDTTAAVGTNYLYAVMAVDAQGNASEALSDSGVRGAVAPPEDLSASDGQYRDRVVLSWTDQTEGDIGYLVRRDGAIVDTTAADAQVYEDAAVDSGTVHQYCVQTLTEGGGASIEVCDSGGIGIFAAPVGVTASDADFDDKVEITWSDPGNLEDGFFVFRGTAGATAVLLDTAAANVTAFVDTSAAHGVDYNYCIAAFSALGGVSAPVCDNGVRSLVVAPTSVQAGDGALENRTRITWESESSTAVAFALYRDGALIKTLNREAQEYEDFTGTAGAEYTYCVGAVTAAEVESERSCDTGLRQLRGPGNVEASDDQFEDRVLVSWVDQSQAEAGYRIYRRQLGAADSVLAGVQAANRSAFIDNGGIAGVEYLYSVAAYDGRGPAAGESPAQSDGGRRTLQAPTSIRASDGEFEDRVEITWDDNSGVEHGYRIERRRLDDPAESASFELEENSTSFEDTSAAFGVEYEYSAMAFDGLGPSEAGRDTGFTTILAPLSFNASSFYGDQVVLRWIDASAVERNYRIERDGEMLALLEGDATSYTDGDAAPGFVHEYCISAQSATASSETVCTSGGLFSTEESSAVADNFDFVLRQERAELVAAEPLPDGRLGWAIAARGQRAIFGSGARGAHIFELVDGTWIERQKLLPDVDEVNDLFGQSVDIDGARAVVGAPNSNNRFGAAYIFERRDGVWHQTARLEAPPEAQPTGAFGTGVALDGDWVLVGVDPQDFETSETGFPGRVYAFNKQGDEWVLAAELRSDLTDEEINEFGSDNFGPVLKARNGRAIVAASGQSAAYIFRRDGDTWTQEARLAPEGLRLFGAMNVALEGDKALISYPNGGEIGSVFTYQRDGEEWLLQDIFSPSSDFPPDDGEWGFDFGFSLALEGDTALIGARNGRAYFAHVYKNDGAGWSRRAELRPTDRTIFATPNALALSGNYGFIADWDDDNLEVAAGTVFAFELVPSPAGMTATDDQFDNRIQLRWQDQNPPDTDYSQRLYRDGRLVESFDPTVQSFADFDIDPGRNYIYCVTTFDQTLGESPPSCDFGRTPADGGITGRVSTRAGAGVEGIQICLDPAPNNALSFDGAGGHVLVDKAPMPAAAFTFELWVKSADAGQDGTLISYGVAGSPLTSLAGNNLVGLGNHHNLTVQILDQTHSTGVRVDDGQWHHLALTWDSASGRMALFVDGVERYLRTDVAQGLLIPADGQLVFGQRQGDDGFAPGRALLGEIDDVRLWHSARSAEQIGANMKRMPRGDTENLAAYWPFDQGAGLSAADLGPDAVGGTLVDGVYWTQDSVDFDVCASTDLEGNYAFGGVRYNGETTFKIKPGQGDRLFEPAFKSITLSTGNPVQNEVAFRDISAFTVAGAVHFAPSPLAPQARCPVPNVDILVDGVLRGKSDRNGRYGVPVDLGPHLIEARLGDHTFAPAGLELQVEGDLAGQNFSDTRTRTLSGRIGGGCNLSIGTATIELRSENECLVVQLEADANYNLPLPPQKYFARLLDVDTPAGLDKADILKFFETLGAREVDLSAEDATLDFVYRAPLKVVINGLPEASCSALGVPVLAQGDRVPLRIEVFEDYGSGGLCPLDSAMVSIFDEIIDEADTPVELAIKDGVATYQTAANTPNIAAGRKDAEGNDRSYQKALTAVATAEGRSATAISWVIVTGSRPREASFTAVSEGVPILILRDPPGDGSAATVEEGETFCTKFNTSFTTAVTAGVTTNISAGIKFEKGTPFFSTDTEAISDSKLGFKVGVEASIGGGFNICATTTETFSTSNDDLFVGEDADVYLGTALNLIFAKSDIIEIVDCQVVQSEAVAMGGEGFETIYLFTESHIRDTVIPQLRDLAVLQPDSTFFYNSAADNWNDHLELNQTLKEEAVPVENRSFSAGANFQFAQENTTTGTFNLSLKVFTEREAALGFGFKESGVGVKGQLFTTLRFESNTDLELAGTTRRRVSYNLSDNDIGDFFTVDVLDDLTYGTPVFITRSGTSSCPWEAGTQPRDEPVITITPPVLRDVPPDEPANFTVGLSNLSQSEEAREYTLRLISTSNPGGALVRANGGFVIGGVNFFIGPNQTQEVTMSVTRGPNLFNYENLALQLVPPCEFARWQRAPNTPLAIADTAYVDIGFKAPCSDIALFRPQSGWVVNQALGDTVELILTDFDLTISETDSIEAVGVEYRRAGTDRWLPAEGEVRRSGLEEGRSVSIMWDTAPLPEDGSYELRAFSRCLVGRTFSGAVVGAIDRGPPQVLGTPEPADAILSFGEDISISFNERIKCTTATQDNIALAFADTDEPIAFRSVCNGETLVITPQVESAELEGRLLEARVENIRDLLDNPMAAPATWSFGVQRTTYAWNQSRIAKEVSFGSPEGFVATLGNGTPQEVDFTLETPPWLSASIEGGTLRAGQVLEVEFAVQQDVPIGTLSDTVVANAGAAGQAQLAVELEVRCLPPEWAVDPGAFEHSMNITAQLLIDGQASIDAEDLVAAVVGGQIRGVAPLQQVEDVDKHLAFITVYSNFPEGETIRFQVWDQSECRLFEATEERFTFSANTTLGTPLEPQLLRATELGAVNVLSVPLSQGWTWFSSNIRLTDPSVTNMLATLQPTAGDLVKSQSAFSQFAATTGWVGPLAELENTASYQIRLADRADLIFDGTALDPAETPIPLSGGWNWIGYIPEDVMPLNQALADLVAQPNDQIKSQDGFAQFVEISPGNSAWIGNLQLLTPGRGYRLWLQNPLQNTFTYPAVPAVAAKTVLPDPNCGCSAKGLAAKPEWLVDARAYEYSMTLTAALENDGAQAIGPQDLVAAFVGDQVRGVAQPLFVEALDRPLVFLMVHSTQPAGEAVHFKVFHHAQDTVLVLPQQLNFSADATLGTPLEPLALNTADAVAPSHGALPLVFALSQNFPNPFNPSTEIHYQIPQSAHVRLSIYNLLGQPIRHLVNGPQQAGTYSTTWDGTDKSGKAVSNGVYFYRLNSGDKEQTKRMLLLK